MKEGNKYKISFKETPDFDDRVFKVKDISNEGILEKFANLMGLETNALKLDKKDLNMTVVLEGESSGNIYNAYFHYEKSSYDDALFTNDPTRRFLIESWEKV